VVSPDSPSVGEDGKEEEDSKRKERGGGISKRKVGGRGVSSCG